MGVSRIELEYHNTRCCTLWELLLQILQTTTVLVWPRTPTWLSLVSPRVQNFFYSVVAVSSLSLRPPFVKKLPLFLVAALLSSWSTRIFFYSVLSFFLVTRNGMFQLFLRIINNCKHGKTIGILSSTCIVRFVNDVFKTIWGIDERNDLKYLLLVRKTFIKRYFRFVGTRRKCT